MPFKPLQRANSTPAALLRSSNSFIGGSARAADAAVERAAFAADPWRGLQRRATFAAVADGSGSDAVAVVDPFSSGEQMSAAIAAEGLRVVRVLSVFNSPVSNCVATGGVSFDATVQHDDVSDDLAATAAAVERLPWRVVAVVAGCETGVALADRLAERLGLLGNGTAQSDARRNKYLMGEAVRAAGVRAAWQAEARVWDDVRDVLQYPAILKPLDSAGSDGVTLCANEADAHAAFIRILSEPNAFGLTNERVLAMEYLAGTEYVVDCVSRDGRHKVVAVWEYDKRPANGGDFVYHAMRLYEGERRDALVAYQRSVLDALGVRNGPSHGEVMWTETGPCLVETGARCHGGEGTWMPIAEACVGYTQVGAAVSAYVRPDKFDALPDEPAPLRQPGAEVFLVARESGTLRALPGADVVSQLPSFAGMHWDVQPGKFLFKTRDCFTRPGSVQLVGPTVEADMAAIRALELEGMFDIGIVCPDPPLVGSVVVVDPFSSGAPLAAAVVRAGYNLVMVFAVKDSPVAHAGFAGGRTLVNDDDSDASVARTAAGLRALPSPLLAVLPGAETGVALADRLSEAIGTRTNGTAQSDARRNKYLMGEAVRAAGVRAAWQAEARVWDDVRDVLQYPAILKPLDSAGSDGVTLCANEADAHAAFVRLLSEPNVFGLANERVLAMEYLAGTEYVVDCVSRDGRHKVVAVWEYDKRPANGGDFVYHSMRLYEGERRDALVAYQRSVLDALGVRNGPSHGEVMWTETGPCLVETGARCHGGEGTWMPIAEACVGYTQLSATLDAYVRPDKFDELPDEPAPLRQLGAEVFLVARSSGVLRGLPGLDAVRALPSFLSMQIAVQPGDAVAKTRDCFTRPGSVQLVGPTVEEDMEVIRGLEREGLFAFGPPTAE